MTGQITVCLQNTVNRLKHSTYLHSGETPFQLAELFPSVRDAQDRGDIPMLNLYCATAAQSFCYLPQTHVTKN